MKWTTKTSTMFPGLMNVYDEDGNSIARDKIPEHARLIAAAPDMLKGLERAEQTIRNLGNAALTGDYKQIALNEAANLRADIAKCNCREGLDEAV